MHPLARFEIKEITKKAVASVDYDALLDRLYGKISLADFRIIETLINNK